MKKLIFAVFLLIASTGLNAQSLSVYEMDTVVEVNSSSVTDYGFYIKIENVSSETVDVYARRAYNVPDCAFDSAYFCWDYCYGSVVDNSIGYVTFNAGDQKSDFSGHVYSPNTSLSCKDSTRYVFFDAKNANDSLSVWVTISAGPTMETIELSINQDVVYPNPANNYVMVEVVDYTDMLLYNSLGALVKNIRLVPGQNAVRIDELSNGFYMYSIDGSSFKRLVVSH
jgi:hypothetical protein